MPKVFIFSPALITRRKISRVEYIVSYKETRSIRSKPTLLLQCQRKLRHERPMLTLESSRSDIPSTKAKVLVDRTNASHRDTDLNPHWWSPTIQRRRRRRQSPAPISFQLSSRKTSLQTKDQPNDLQPFLSGQDKASSKPSCKEVIFRQQPRLLSDSAPLRVWIACIIFGFALRDNQPQPPEYLEAVTAVAANIKWLFAIYPLQDEVVFLALWYASHIMPEGVLDQFDLYQPDGIVLATRLFVLSYTLAIKWLSDETYSLQHWVPHYQKGFSISSAKALDKAALELLDYNLHIPSLQWTAWLHKLDQSPSANILVADAQIAVQAKIHNLIFKSEASGLSSPQRSRSISTSATSVWKVHKILFDNLAISVPFPEPAPWNPSEDPIIHTTGRRQPFTQAPSPWSCGNHCYFPQPHVSPLVVYNSQGEVRAELLRPVWQVLLALHTAQCQNLGRPVQPRTAKCIKL